MSINIDGRDCCQTGQPSQDVTDGALTEGLESGHGFRHEFSTIMNEHEWPADAIEVQLAHANGGSVRGIYNHAQYLDKRREMMQWWADWLDEKVE